MVKGIILHFPITMHLYIYRSTVNYDRKRHLASCRRVFSTIVLKSTLLVFIYSSKKNLVRFSMGSKAFSLPGGPDGIPKGRRPVTYQDNRSEVETC